MALGCLVLHFVRSDNSIMHKLTTNRFVKMV